MSLYPSKSIVQSKAKCPKCKSNNLMIAELWINHVIEWEQLDGKFDRNDGVLNPGDAYKVVCTCKDCDHVWTARKATQIDDIIQ